MIHSKHKRPKESTVKKVAASAARRARKMKLKGERRNAYIYGAKRKTGWKPKRELNK